MKINITTNHIRIYRLLNFLPERNIEFIANFLKMNKQNVILYIKQIHHYVENKSCNISLIDIINEISKDKSLLKTLKKHQIFCKDDRIFYIILKLLRDYELNLNTLASILNVSRRTLNDDLICVKNNLKFYNLEIFSIPSKGISISDKGENRKICSLSYLFKFLIEIDELPALMYKDYSKFFQENIYRRLNNDINYFAYIFDFDIFINNKKLIKSLYIVYGYESSRNRINTLPYEEFKKYFIDIFSQKNMERAYNFFKNSILGDFPIKYINILILTLKFCNGTLKKDDFLAKKECSKLKDIFSKNVSFNLSQDNFFEKFLNRVSIASKESSFLNMMDLSFLSLALDEKIILECTTLFLELRKIYFNIQLSNIIFLYLWNLNTSSISELSNTIVVFKEIPKFLHPIIQNTFFIKENIRISKFIMESELDSYISNDENISIITFEELKIKTRYPFIKRYSLPL